MKIGEMAFESQVEESHELWRVTFYKHWSDRKIRCTNYFGNQHDCQEFIGRIEPDDLIGN